MIFEFFTVGLSRAVRGLFVWKTRFLVWLTLGRAGLFRIQGKWEKAAREMTSVLGLEDADFDDPARSLSKIRRRLADVNPATAILFFMQLSTFLVDDKKQDWAAAVHELDAGLCPEDYANIETIRTRLQARTNAFNTQLQFLYGIRLANVLGLSGRARDQLSVLEAQLGLLAEDYLDPERLHQLLIQSWPAVSPSLKAMAVGMLAGSLGEAGRRVESVRVLEAALGLTKEDYSEPEVLRTKISTGIGSLGVKMGLQAAYLSLLSKALEDLGRYSESILLYEADFKIDASTYRDPTRLAEKLRARTAALNPELAMYSVTMFIRALTGAKRFEESLAVLNADLETDVLNVDQRELSTRLRSRCESLPDNIASFYQSVLVFTLALADRRDAAIAVLKADSGLMSIDWRDTARLASGLNDFLGDLAPHSRIMLAGLLAAAFELADEDERAAQLTDAYLRFVSPLDAEPRDAAVLAQYCFLYASWLESWGKDIERQPLEACRKLIPKMRKILAEQGVELVDRERFIRQASDLRRRVLETGFYWLEREEHSAAAGVLRREIFLWDLEFAQRLVIERYTLVELHPAPEGQAIAEGALPSAFATTSFGAGYLPPRSGPNGLLGALDLSQHLLGGSDPVRTLGCSPLTRRLSELVNEKGLEEARVAKALGPKGLLLRATFDAEGSLVWGALRPNESSLEVVAHGKGSQGDLNRLRWATARHDFITGLIRWLGNRAGRRFAVLKGRVHRVLRDALLSLAAPLDLAERVNTAQGLVSSQVSERDARLIIQLLTGLARPMLLGGEAAASQEIGIVQAALDQVFSESRPRILLDSTTEAYLSDVANIWQLEGLQDSLEDENHLVAQVDDTLHSVPVAWLPIDGQPLYRRVSTVRNSLAPQLDSLLSEIDTDGVAPSDSPRLISLSYFDPLDRAQNCAGWLHRGHRHLAERFGALSFAGADQESGTIGALRATLAQNPSLSTVAICGHGDWEQAGIRLGDETGQPALWHGQGCDFSGVDWLLMVSCSIGRAADTGDLDVEGFCSQLAIHRARSILACRWPVASKEAVAFANEAVHQYLKLEGQSERRALAVASARRALCEGTDPFVGLNVAAAFDLYGLG